jgi:hypothetical protein
MASFVEKLDMEKGRGLGAEEVENLIFSKQVKHIINSFDDEMKDRLLTVAEFKSIIVSLIDDILNANTIPAITNNL